MTAVDHAELKRVADELVQMLAPDQGESAHPAFGHAVRIQNAHAALLSEIEGLKAERDEANANGASHWSRAVEAERQLADIRTQAPDSWRPDREAINAAIEDADKRLAYGMELIKLVDGDHTYRLKIDGQTLFFTDSETEDWNAQERLYAHIHETKNRIRADAVIAALRPQTAESGK